MSTLTLRLTDDEQQQLEKLKEFTDHKTASGALKQMLSNYLYYVGESERYKREVLELDNQLQNVTGKVKSYIRARDDLSDMAYGEEWKKEIDRRVRAIESGESKGYSLSEFKEKIRREIHEAGN